MREFFMKTERTGFSVWSDSDIDLAKLLWGNPEVTKYICASGSFTGEEIAERLNKETDNYRNSHIQYWPVFVRDSDELIGCCGLRPHSPGYCEIGFHLLPEYWGKGYAFETGKAVIDYAFSVLGLKGLYAGHNSQNIRSKQVLLKLGFEYIGDEYYEPTGLYHPTYELHNPLKP